MMFLSMLGFVMFSFVPFHADQQGKKTIQSEEISSADAQVLVDEDCGCGNKKKKPKFS